MCVYIIPLSHTQAMRVCVCGAYFVCLTVRTSDSLCVCFLCVEMQGDRLLLLLYNLRRRTLDDVRTTAQYILTYIEEPRRSAAAGI